MGGVPAQERLALRLAMDRIGLLAPLARVMPTVPGGGNDIKKPGQDEVAYDRVPIKSVIQILKLQDDVRGDLAQVTQPLMVFTAPGDHMAGPVNSGSVMTEMLDNVAETIFAESLEFLLRHS